MKFKTAEEIYQENGCNSKRDIIEAMKEYAGQFIDIASEEAEADIILSREHPDFDYAKINKESILKVKQLIK